MNYNLEIRIGINMRKLKLYSVILLTALSLAMPASFAQRAASKPKVTTSAAIAAARGVDTISAAQLKSYLYFIASDEMEGRDTPSRGLDTTAQFLKMNLERWSFKPAGDDGTFFQKIGLRREQIDGAHSTAEINGHKFNFGEDFLPNAVGATISGPLVYVGRGWIVPSKNIDDYKGIEVKDKIMVVLGGGLPPRVTQADVRANQGQGLANPGLYAQQHGAKGILVIPNATVTQNWEQQRQRAMLPARAIVEKFQTQTGAPVPTVTMSMKMATALFEGEKFDPATLFARE